MPGETSPAFLRLFIAIAVPPEVREPIRRAQSQLQRCVSPGAVRWTKPEQFHLTLKFLGDVPSEQLSAVEKSASAICAGFGSLNLRARGVGFFPGRHKPRVIWAGATDMENRLEELHRHIDEAMRPFAPAEKPGKFAGHITLGRFKPGRRTGLEKLMERAEAQRNQSLGDWSAMDVEIVQCDLTSVGALHTPVASCRLTG